MTDFELRRQLRELRGPHEPDRDLWPQIARQIAGASPLVPAEARHRRWPLALAAGIALAVSSAIFSLALQHRDGGAGSTLAESRNDLSVREQIERARELASTGDPRLAAPEVVLDSASGELELALQQRPDATFLVGLINRTHAQRRRLARLGLEAG